MRSLDSRETQTTEGIGIENCRTLRAPRRGCASPTSGGSVTVLSVPRSARGRRVFCRRNRRPMPKPPTGRSLPCSTPRLARVSCRNRRQADASPGSRATFAASATDGVSPTGRRPQISPRARQGRGLLAFRDPPSSAESPRRPRTQHRRRPTVPILHRSCRRHRVTETPGTRARP